MAKWSLTAEFIAFIFIMVMMLQTHGGRNEISTVRRRLFQASLYLAASSTVLNACCVEMLDANLSAPYWLNMAANTLYFAVSVWMTSTIVVYLVDLLLEHVFNRRAYRHLMAVVIVLNFAFLVLYVVNSFNGILFSVESDGTYVRGPLNQLGYAALTLEMIMVLACYFVYRPSVGTQVKRVMRILPPIIAALCVFQLLYPEVYLNGTIAAAALLVIALGFQSNRAGVDGLTGLGDRKSLYDDLTLRMTGDQPFQIISVALRNFSTINQRFGHREADELLYAVASWIGAFDRKGRAFRYGKVSFAIISPYHGPSQSERALEEVASRFDSPWSFAGTTGALPAACCLLVCENPDWTPAQVISYLDVLTNHTKQGQLRTARFDVELERFAERRRYLTEELVDAIERRRFTMNYQPIYSCAERRFVRAEALLRLNDRQGAPVSPGEFVNLAEEIGLIDEISWIMIDDVCRFLQENPQLELEAVSVNLSMPQMLDPRLNDRFEACLREHGIAPGRVKIEVTERLLAQSAQTVERTMSRFKEAGVGFYLDDFGTGYSNYSLVMRLPFENAKIDRSLLANIASSQNDRETIRCIVELFHTLGISVTAEGVETEEQAQAVRECGADYIQGFLYARPLSEGGLLELLASAEGGAGAACATRAGEGETPLL